MPREMRLIDAESFSDKLKSLLRIAERKADERACSTLSYVLDLMVDEPCVVIGSVKKEVKRHKYGEYQNVLLSDEEYEKIQAEFPGDFEARIEKLSEYIAKKGDRYKSHLAVIRSWAREEEAESASGGGSFDTDEFFEAAVAAARRKK